MKEIELYLICYLEYRYIIWYNAYNFCLDRFGCGNNIHIKCMMVWAEHNRKSSGDNNITCPLCREDFGPFNRLLQVIISCTEIHNLKNGSELFIFSH